MGITSVREIWNGRSGNRNDKTKREYVRVFRIQSDSNNEDIVSIGLSSSLPQIYDSYPTDSAATVTSASVKAGEVPYIFEAEIKYSTDTADQNREGEENPLDKPYELTVTFSKQQVAISKDVSGIPILNSAGQSYETPPQIDQCRPVITVKRNLASFDAITANGYVNKTNSVAYLSFAAGSLKCQNFGGSLKREKGTNYWEVTLELEANPSGTWALQLLDQGTNERIAGSLHGIKDKKTGQAVTSPVPLNGAGRVATPGSEVYQNYTVYDTADFNLLGLL